MATASRPYGFFGKPLLASDVISVQVFPPSVERNNPLAEGAVGLSPPERYSQPLRRKSHIAANMISGLSGSIFTSVQPVERFAPFRTCCHFLPPSVVLYKPRSGESLHNAPGTATNTVSLFLGSMAIRATRSEFSRPARDHVSPPSVDLYIPSPMDTLLRVHDSPVPTQTFFEFFGSSAMAPIDCTGCSSNTDRYRVPLSSDFQTPPLAAPTKSVILPDGSRVPATAEMRPLIVAEPMLRAPRPEMVAELNGASSPQQEITERSRNESDARTPRTPKALRAKCKATFVVFCESFRSSHALSRRAC